MSHYKRENDTDTEGMRRYGKGSLRRTPKNVPHGEFARRLQQALDLLTAPHEIIDIAKACEVSYETARKWYRGLALPEGINLEHLAKFVRQSPGWLQFGEVAARGFQSSDSQGRRVRAVPFFRWTQLASFMDDIIKKEGSACPTLPSGIAVTEFAYGTEVQGDAMSPTLQEGHTMIVDPGLTPGEGDIVLYMDDGERPIARRLIREGADTYLKPDNARYPIRPLADPTHIMGVVVYVGKALRGN